MYITMHQIKFRLRPRASDLIWRAHGASLSAGIGKEISGVREIVLVPAHFVVHSGAIVI